MIVTLPQAISFNSCRFEEDVLFAGPWEQSDAIQSGLSDRMCYLIPPYSAGQTRFAHARFEGMAGFDGCTFSHVCSFQQV